jgi:peptide/nickel transport system permease protein
VLDFLLKRLFYSLLVLLGVIIVVFFIFNVLPGDPARLVLGQRADVSSIEAINKDLGRDKPLAVQFLIYLNDLSPLSLHELKNQESSYYLNKEKYSGSVKLFSFNSKALVLKSPYLRRSYQTKRRVTDILVETLPNTTILAISAMIFATIVGIFLGTIAAVKKDGLIDRISLVLSISGTSVPSFFAGIIIAWLFGFVWHKYTGLNMTGNLYEIDPFEGEILTLKNLILPAFALGIRPLAIVVQLSRSSMLDVLSKDYIRTAAAKGLSYYQIITRHAIRNSLNPVITAISGWFASLMAGAFFVEYIFGWRGIGKVTVEALEKYDFPVVMGSVIFVALFFIVINILVDIIYGLLDPRIRLS